MTKKQFLKKSKNCLKDSGVELLQTREIFSKEKTGKIEVEEAYKNLDIIRKKLESIFFKYEALKPPSKCKNLHRKILNTLIILQEAVVLNDEYLLFIKEGSEEQANLKYETSLKELERFRAQYRDLSKEVNKYLTGR